jgi:cytochrome c-type biogenesis protein CcmE
LRRERRRERLKVAAGYVAAVALSVLLAWVAVHVAVGG